MTETILGQSEQSRAGPLYFCRPPDRDSFYGDDDLPDLAMREDDWKLLCEYDGSDVELYDLATDREESNNVAADHPQIVNRMKEQLLAWHQEMPPDNGATFRLNPGKKAVK